VGRILVVDPSLCDRVRLRVLLTAVGHEVIERSDPALALEDLLAMPPGSIDLVITELQFNSGSGERLLWEIKRREALQDLPVIITAAPVPRERVIWLVQQGAATIINKPFSADVLLRRVTETLAAAPEVGRRQPAGQGSIMGR
jgi:DNA-binding NtrC family response regulator